MAAGATPLPHSPHLMLISIVVPARNEEDVLRELHRRLREVCDPLPYDFEFVIVNDGSDDATPQIIRELRNADPRVACVDLSRAFGKELALTAGLRHAVGDAVIITDADLQDPPELFPLFIEEWLKGFDVVYGVRTERKGESAVKKLTAYLFYRVVDRMSSVRIPRDTGDFRLMSRRAVDALLTLPEHHRFMKGLFAWIGFPHKGIQYVREPRHSGQTNFNYWKLWNFAIEGITSFSIGPLKLATYLGLFIAFGAFAYAAYIVWDTLINGNPVPGYPSLMAVILFLGGVQLMTIGVLGEYVGRIFNETKHRPLYLVTEFLPSAPGASRGHSGK